MTDDQSIVVLDADSQPAQPKAKRRRGRVDDSIAAPREAKRRRGGQPGNTNALRHGFYARDLGKISPSQYSEAEMRNLLGEAAMLKDYMYFIYKCNLDSTDSAVLSETLRALALAGMSLSRLLQVHNNIRVVASGDSTFTGFLDSMNAAVSRANRLLDD